VATSATPEVVLEMFPRTFAVGAHFGVVLVASGGGADGAGATHTLQENPTEESTDKEPVGGMCVTEVATFRTDLAYSDGRHPDGVRYTKTAEEDVQRRDFTINGLLLDPVRAFPQGLKPGASVAGDVRAEARTLQTETGTLQAEARTLQAEARTLQEKATAGPRSTPIASAICAQGRLSTSPLAKNASGSPQDDKSLGKRTDLRGAVLDYVGGLADLDADVVRAIGRPEKRFEEDHLRMLRGVRFAARFGFELEAETKHAIRSLASKIHAVSRERVRDELTKMLTEGHARRAFELLDETGLLSEVLPEVARMKGVEQPAQFHPEGDVWVHTLLLLGSIGAGMQRDAGVGSAAARCGQAANVQARSGSD